MCYRYNEKLWGKDEDEEWGEGRVLCPADYFTEIYSTRSKRRLKTGSMKNLFSHIFGERKINEDVPRYCEFGDGHLEKGEQEGV